MANKSYWQEAYIGSDTAKENVKSWFGCMAEGMTPYKAELLCDSATDRNKKIRSFMTNAEGRHYQFERTLGGKNFTISMKAIAPPSVAPHDQQEAK